jgi:hypothetical protein
MDTARHLLLLLRVDEHLRVLCRLLLLLLRLLLCLLLLLLLLLQELL